MNTINQLTPFILFEQKETIEEYLATQFEPIITNKSWMKDWKQIAQRFRLLQFVELNKEEALTYQWDTEKIKGIIEEVLSEVQQHLSLENVNITVVPALPFPWTEKFDRSMWTNGFTNSPNSIQIAIPPNPDEQFLKYLIAHELHHASPSNPIYKLSLDSFTLGDWYKMEGTAEFFSLHLYEDKRWWKNDFTKDMEPDYWRQAKQKMNTTDDEIKGRFCFGDPKNGIPFMAGYAFAYEMVKSYVEKYPISNFEELYSISPQDLMEAYEESTYRQTL